MPAFIAAGSRLSDMAERPGTIADGTIGAGIVDLLWVRGVGTEIKGYPFHMTKDADGVG